jgi:hypothetical protein
MDSSKKNELHVFVSSPGDVVEKRVVIRRVLERVGNSSAQLDAIKFEVTPGKFGR